MTDTNELSEREKDVLRLVATGASNKEIAQKLFISTNTVKVHLRNIYTKINVSSRTEAAMYAINEGLIESPSIPEEDDGQQSETSLDGISEGTDIESSDNMYDLRSNRRQIIYGIVGLILIFSVIAISIYTIRSGILFPTTEFQSPAEIPRWEVLSEMPTERFGMAVATVEDTIFVIGGEDDKGVVDIVESYDPQTDKWITLPSKPIPVSDVSAVTIAGNIFVPGGRLDTASVSDVLEIYDPQRKEWTLGARMPIGLSAYGLSAFEGKVYLFGGWNGQQFVADVYEYDPGKDLWQMIGAMSSPRGYVGAANSSDRIHVIGGFDGNNVLDTNQAFQPSRAERKLDPWQESSPLPEPLSSMGIASIAEIIYIIGGESSGQREFSALAYFPDKDEWQIVEDPIIEVGSHSGVVSIGTNLFNIGGEISSHAVDDTQRYQAIYTVSIPVIVK